jgi:hypothetical protein
MFLIMFPLFHLYVLVMLRSQIGVGTIRFASNRDSVNHSCTFVFGGDTKVKTKVQQRSLIPLFYNLRICEPYALNAYGFHMRRLLLPVSDSFTKAHASRRMCSSLSSFPNFSADTDSPYTLDFDIRTGHWFKK